MFLLDYYFRYVDTGTMRTHFNYNVDAFANNQTLITMFIFSSWLQTSSYMHYSDCDCVVADRRQDICYQYSRNKHAGYGFLSVIVGIITAILLYLFFDSIFNKSFCCYQTKNMVETNTTIPENNVEPVEAIKPEPEVETLNKLEAPRIRKHHCWACEVKYNNAPVPAWYKMGSRTYRN